MTNTSQHRRIVIGRYEGIDVLNPAILAIPSKTDTGAFRSAIHATDIRIVRTKEGRFLKCKLLGHRCYPESFDFKTKRFEKVAIRNSFGHRENRYEVSLRIKLGPRVFTTNFTLADRSESVFPVLMGRKLMRGRFLVDPGEAGIDRVELKKRYNITTPDEED